jgi:hypothetical protein
MENPYTQNIENEIIQRTFDEAIDEMELVWHRDKKDRMVKVIQSEGWKFQMDNELPIELKRGTELFIPKEVYHRVIKGNGELKIEIKE